MPMQEFAVARLPYAVYNSLTRRSIELRALYRDAAAHAHEPGLRAVLDENAQTLEQLVIDLQGQVRRLGGQPVQRGPFGTELRRRLGSWLLPPGAHHDHVLILRLARNEAALLHAFEHAIDRASPEPAVDLRRLLPRLQGIHLDMDSLVHDGRC